MANHKNKIENRFNPEDEIVFGKTPLNKSLIKLYANYLDTRFFTYFNPDNTPEKKAKDNLISQIKVRYEY